MFPRFYLLILLGWFIITINSLNYMGSLTENECKAYLASNEINKKLQAIFSCPKKWRVKPKSLVARQNQYSLFNKDQDH